jgi:hypothetical protein
MFDWGDTVGVLLVTVNAGLVAYALIDLGYKFVNWLGEGVWKKK